MKDTGWYRTVGLGVQRVQALLCSYGGPEINPKKFEGNKVSKPSSLVFWTPIYSKSFKKHGSIQLDHFPKDDHCQPTNSTNQPLWRLKRLEVGRKMTKKAINIPIAYSSRYALRKGYPWTNPILAMGLRPLILLGSGFLGNGYSYMKRYNIRV